MNHLKQLVVACGLSVMGVSVAAQSPAQASQPVAVPQLERADLEAWLDGFVPYGLQQGDIAGLVVSVVKNGEVLLEKGYGYADVAQKTPMDPERTVMHAASISKSFIATAVMQLVEQGKLDLHRDVNDYLDFKIPEKFGKPITLHHLLTHTAGFEETSYKKYNSPLTLRQHLLMIPDRIYPPGEVPAYSNYGLDMTGYIVQRVSGERISEYIERHILQPLGMQHSTFHVTLPKALQPLAAKNYRVASTEPYPSNLLVELAPADSPSTALATTAYDMTRYMLAHLQQGRYGDYQLLHPQSVQIMQAPAFVPIPGTLPVSLGLFRTDYNGHRIIGHSGDVEGFHTDMKLLTDDNVGFFVAANSDGAVQGLIPAAFTLRNALIQKFMDRYFPAPTTQDEPTAPTAKEHAHLAVGEYVWSRQQKGDYQEALFLLGRFLALRIDVHANADGTVETPAFIAFEGGPTKTWREVSPFVWREVGGKAHLFMKARDGQVQSLWTDEVASFMVDLKVPFLWSAGLNIPLLGLASSTLLVTVLLWPIAAIVRRRYGQTLQLAEPEGRAYRLTRFAALLGVLYMFGWVIALAADFSSTVGVEPWIRLIQLIGLACVAGAAVAVWNARLTCLGQRSRWAKAWSTVLALALLYIVWFSFSFHLISVHLS